MSDATQLALDLDDPYKNDGNALNTLFQQSAQYRQSTAYVELMRFIARFPKYSPYNCMLLHIQNPEVTHVATPNQWRRDFKRTIKPHARPLLILAPRCPVLFVYDLADTEGEYLPPLWASPFEAHGKLDVNVWHHTVENCKLDGIYLDLVEHYSFLHAGTAFRLRGSNHIVKEHVEEPFDFLIEINASQNLPGQYATLAHELGHIFSGHLGAREDDWWTDRSRIQRQEEEIEAASISYLVCTRCGLETKSAEYLSLYAKENVPLPHLDLDVILKATYQIEQMGEKILPKRKKSKKASRLI